MPTFEVHAVRISKVVEKAIIRVEAPTADEALGIVEGDEFDLSEAPEWKEIGNAVHSYEFNIKEAGEVLASGGLIQPAKRRTDAELRCE